MATTDWRTEDAARRQACDATWALIHLAQLAGLGPVCAEHGWLAGLGATDGSCMWCTQRERAAAREARRLAHVRTPPRPPFEREPKRCNLCGTPPEGKRRTWCSDDCVHLWFVATSGQDAYRELVALHGQECWECGRQWDPGVIPWHLDVTHRVTADRRQVLGPWPPTPVALAVDHVRPLWSLTARERRDLKWWLPFNLQLLCTSCHAAKTRREAGLRARAKREGVRPSTVWLGWDRLRRLTLDIEARNRPITGSA